MKFIAILALAAALSGCSALSPQPSAPPVADLAPRRCPEVASADLRALSQAPLPPPAGDVTKASAQQWIDGLGAQVRQMNRAGARLVALYRKCRRGEVKVAAR